MNFQIVDCPSSVGSICVFSVFQENYSITNLHVALIGTKTNSVICNRQSGG